jgi:cytidylate kinase
MTIFYFKRNSFIVNKIIAIDGPVASGKGTIAKKLAAFYNLPYMNTGGLYRAIGLYLLKNSLKDFTPTILEKLLPLIDFSNLDNPDLYTEDVGNITAQISPLLVVRNYLLLQQRNFAHREGGSILDGRDIGTVICPEAAYKFFITADVDVRARRRYREMIAKGLSVDYNEILTRLQERDTKDKTRSLSPLEKAEDAVEIDTTHLTVEEVFKKVSSLIRL